MAKNMDKEKDKQMEPRIYSDPISFFFSFLNIKIDSGLAIANSQNKKFQHKTSLMMTTSLI